MWHWGHETVARWHGLRAALGKKVATARLGKNGLRGRGCVRANLQRRDGSPGAGLSRETPGEVAAKRPCEGSMHRFERRPKREREHGREVRNDAFFGVAALR
eukprot:313512-Pyramimonas_sp.AAC.1